MTSHAFIPSATAATAVVSRREREREGGRGVRTTERREFPHLRRRSEGGERARLTAVAALAEERGDDLARGVVVLDEEDPQGAAREDLVPPHQRPPVHPRRGRGGRRRAGACLCASSASGGGASTGGVGVGRHSIAAGRSGAEQEPARTRRGKEGKEGAVGKISAIFFPRGGRHVSGDGAGIEPRPRSSSWMKSKPEARRGVEMARAPNNDKYHATPPRYFPLPSEFRYFGCPIFLYFFFFGCI
jgi:hypothetical protein